MGTSKRLRSGILGLDRSRSIDQQAQTYLGGESQMAITCYLGLATDIWIWVGLNTYKSWLPTINISHTAYNHFSPSRNLGH